VPPKRRYPTDLTDRQWELIESLLPEPPAGPAGRPAAHSKREVVNAILYMTRAGCSWRMLPKTRDDAAKELLLAYNEADCQALRALADELTRLREFGAEDPRVDSSTRPKPLI